MSEDRQNLRQYIQRFEAGEFDGKDTHTQCEAGWYDWFCRDTSLRNKTYALTAKLQQVLKADAVQRRINLDTMYVFFKNNCPVNGSLYDDFRICDVKTHDVLWTITPRSGFRVHNGQASVWGRENGFKEPLAEGTWKDVLAYFKDPTSRKVRMHPEDKAPMIGAVEGMWKDVLAYFRDPSSRKVRMHPEDSAPMIGSVEGVC